MSSNNVETIYKCLENWNIQSHFEKIEFHNLLFLSKCIFSDFACFFFSQLQWNIYCGIKAQSNTGEDICCNRILNYLCLGENLFKHADVWRVFFTLFPKITVLDVWVNFYINNCKILTITEFNEEMLTFT